MNTNRLWTLGALLVIGVVLVATYFVGVSPQLAAVSAANEETEGVAGQNVVAEATLTKLKDQFEGIDALRTDLKNAQVVVPPALDQALLIGQIGDTAKSNDVDVLSIAFTEPTPFIEATSDDVELSAALSKVNPQNFLVVPVDIAVTGKYSDVMNFVDDLQNGDRLLLVHDLAMAEGEVESGSSVTLALATEVFVLLEVANTPAIPGTEEEGTAAAEPTAE